MPLVRAKKQEVNPEAMYVAWESFGTLRHDLTVKAGTRLRGDHPAVQGWPQYFLPADTPDDEIASHQRREYAKESAAAAHSAKQPDANAVRVPDAPPLRDEDAVVAIRRAGLVSSQRIHDATGELKTVDPGDKLPRNHAMVKRERDAFVDVTNGVPRERAVKALQSVSSDDGEGNVRTIHAGQWCDKNDALVQINPYMFERVGFE